MKVSCHPKPWFFVVILCLIPFWSYAASSDAWTAHTSGTTNTLTAIAWNGTEFVTIGVDGTILTSPDGVKWTKRTSGTTYDLVSIAWSGTKFVAVGSTDGNTPSVIVTSPNGVTWTIQSPGATYGGFSAVTWNGTVFVALVSGDFIITGNIPILTSPDGVTWTPHDSGTINTLWDLAWNGTQFAAVGSSGAILTSPDGVTWTPRNSGTTDLLEGIHWNGTQFVAVGWDFATTGIILTSPDAVAWTARTSGTTKLLWSVTWSGSQFVAVGDHGTILTSPNGSAWTAHRSGTTNALEDIAGNGHLLVAVGVHGTILSTSATASKVKITTQPKALTVKKGGTANFTVKATGTAPLTYQWQRNNANLANKGNIAGATSAKLTLTHVTSANAGKYRVIVANPAGKVTSVAVTLTVK